MSAQKKRSPSPGGYTRKGELLVDSAKRLSQEFDPVKTIAELTNYHRLLVKMAKENGRVK